jgi:hypothetical protein
MIFETLSFMLWNIEEVTTVVSLLDKELMLRCLEYVLGTDLAIAIPLQACLGPEVSKRLTLSDFKTLGS